MKESSKQKALLLLSAGITLSLTRSPKKYFKILKNLPKEWREINKSRLYKIVREFYNDRLVSFKEDKEGTVTVILTKDGEKKALRFKIDEIKVKKPLKWDGEWRIVIFDIPEKFKKAREALRNKLKELGFLELQKSVFIFPYECEDEINFIVEVFQIRPFVRFICARTFTNEEQLKIRFGLY